MPTTCSSTMSSYRERSTALRTTGSMRPIPTRLRQDRDMGNMERLEAMVARLPEAVRVDIEAWDGEPTFRVRGKNFIFTDRGATGISVKLPKEEAIALVATEPGAEPTGYGLGRHGWVSV